MKNNFIAFEKFAKWKNLTYENIKYFKISVSFHRASKITVHPRHQ